MDRSHPDQRSKEGRHCRDWPLGICSFGNRCSYYHHHNLDPKLPREYPDFSISNVSGEACSRCVQKGLVCDKPGRAEHAGDPCSECRWFGGDRCNCTLSKTTSYNDQAWVIMMQRRDAGYTIPEPRDDRAATDAMPTNRLVHQWRGRSPSELYRAKSIWPSFFRRNPRPYLVPPRDSAAKREQDRGTMDANVKRKREEDECATPAQQQAVAASSTVHTSQGFLRPPAEPRLGIVKETTYNWLTNTWTHRYERGSISVTEDLPTTPAATTDTQPVLASRNHEEDTPPVKKQRFDTS